MYFHIMTLFPEMVLGGLNAVSYTHLDVYKRQRQKCASVRLSAEMRWLEKAV